jgi:hypothetical protein
MIDVEHLSLSLMRCQNRHGGYRLFYPDQAAAIFGDGDTRAFDLACACLPPQLRDQFMDLSEARRPEWMPW